MSEITISAVIPAYNAEESIRDAVASMLGQSLGSGFDGLKPTGIGERPVSIT